LDLSPAGHQPMHLPERGLSIVFNGEIYNFLELRRELERHGHTFRSHSDTEVLLVSYATWGKEFLYRLNGMFAIAIYDAEHGLLTLARDRAGEKPLFYYLDGRSLYFASELKALLAHPDLPRRIDPESLDSYLATGFVPGHSCILKGYNKLPPAHALTFDLGRCTSRVWAYWMAPELERHAVAADETMLLSQLETLLEDAVRRQLVADVPVGVLLSGGVDSSLVTALAARCSGQVRTFTIGFPGDSKHDETAHARLIANYFGTQHTELIAEPTTADIIPCLAREFDEPMVDSSMIPTWLVSHLVRKYCTVALGGDGGDELFGGYTYYNRLLWMQRYISPIPDFLRKKLALIAEDLLPVGLRGRNYLLGLGSDLSRSLPLLAIQFDPKTRRNLMRGHPSHALVAEDLRLTRIPQQSDLLQRATRMDFRDYLAEDILVKVDRASMLNSLEIRAPFLDYRLIEFAFGSVPSHLKTTIADNKILLRRLVSRILPPEFDNRRSQGFSLPLAEWLKTGPFRDLFWDTLSRADCEFDRDSISVLWNEQDRGLNNGERLFSLVLFELWRREYGILM